MLRVREYRTTIYSINNMRSVAATLTSSGMLMPFARVGEMRTLQWIA